MAILLLRNQKGQPLSNAEVDGNFSALNTELIADTLAIANHMPDSTTGVAKGGSVHAVATTSVAGFMSATDKTSLNSLVTSATNGASTTASGPVQLATNAETLSGLSTTKAITPSSLASVLSAGVKTATWTVTEDATNKALYFKYNGVTKAKLDTNGNLVLLGSVTSGVASIT
jgi:hypothetical protein